MSKTSISFAAFVVLVACGQSAPPKPNVPPPPAAKLEGARPAAAEIRPTITTATATTLSILATGTTPSPETVASLTSGRLSVSDYVDQLVKDDRAIEQVMRSVFKESLALDSNLISEDYVLKSKILGDGRTLYYLWDPCAPAKAVEVAPWWSPSTKVLVCPSAYQPKKFEFTITNAGGKSVIGCSSVVAQVLKACGCGENLARCARDADQRKAVHASAYAEVIDTAKHILRSGRPFDDVFRTNETIRDDNVEAVYRRWEVERGAPTSFTGLFAANAEPGLRPRTEIQAGQHAGLLTTPKLIFFDGGMRQRMRVLFEVLWCSTPRSVGSTVESVLNLPRSNGITSKGWEELAARPVCTRCHARTDYAMQFWLGYPNQSSGAFTFDPKLTRSAEHGRLYSVDIDDPRGEGQLTPRSFVDLFLAEPEYASCMTKRVTEYVFTDRLPETDRAGLEQAFGRSRDLLGMFKSALLLYATRAPQPPLPEPPSSTPVIAADGTVAVPKDVATFLENACLDCHSDGGAADTVDLSSFRYSKALITRMLDQTAYGRMPLHPQTVSLPERDWLVKRLIDVTWPKGDVRDQALDYYATRFRSAPSHYIGNALTAVAGVAGSAPPSVWGTAETGIDTKLSTLTPGYLTVVGLQALQSCASAATEAAKADCLEQATAPALLTR